MPIQFFDESEAQDRRLQMLINAAQAVEQNKIAREELELKKQQMDPEYQRRQLAATIGLVNPELAERMFNSGVTLPSQTQAPTSPSTYRDMIQGNLPTRNPQSMGVVPTEITGGTIKVGPSSFKLAQPGMDDVEKAKLDVGKTLATEGMKAAQQQKVGAEKSLTGTTRLLQQFSRSRKELEAFDPEIGKEGYSGWISRRGGDIANYFDNLPETKALGVNAKPIAYRMARDMEGGRTTDQDRRIFVDTFADALKYPDKANQRIAASAIINYFDSGADEAKVLSTLKDLESSDVDVLRNIAMSVYEDLPQLRIKSLGLNSDEWEVQSGK